VEPCARRRDVQQPHGNVIDCPSRRPLSRHSAARGGLRPLPLSGRSCFRLGVRFSGPLLNDSDRLQGSLWHTLRSGVDEPLIQGEAALGARADSGRPGHAVHAGLRISHWLMHVHTLRATARAVHVNQIGVAQRGPVVGASALRRLTFPVRVARRRATVHIRTIEQMFGSARVSIWHFSASHSGRAEPGPIVESGHSDT
jgi:hypothetical protein